MIERFRLIIFSIIAVALAAIAFTPAKACACADPMPNTELVALIAKADGGDLDAVSAVWQEYALIRRDSRNTKIWERRAIKVGAPRAVMDIASNYLDEVERSRNTHAKVAFANAALALMERLSINRHLMRKGDSSAGSDEAIRFVTKLRTSRALVLVLRDGVAPWLRRANAGDPIAAHHVAIFYNQGELDQKKRAYWERRASLLGDPSFAGQSVARTTTAEDLRDIDRALRDKQTLARAGDPWMQEQLTRDLVETRKRLSKD